MARIGNRSRPSTLSVALWRWRFLNGLHASGLDVHTYSTYVQDCSVQLISRRVESGNNAEGAVGCGALRTASCVALLDGYWWCSGSCCFCCSSECVDTRLAKTSASDSLAAARRCMDLGGRRAVPIPVRLRVGCRKLRKQSSQTGRLRRGFEPVDVACLLACCLPVSSGRLAEWELDS